MNQLSDNTFDSLLKVYPETKAQFDYAKKNNITLKVDRVYQMFLKRMLFDNKFTEFYDTIKPNELIKSCHIIINGELIDCGKKTLRITLDFYGDFYASQILLTNFNDSHKKLLVDKNFGNNLEKVSIKLKRFNYSFIGLKSMDNLMVMNENSETNIYYSSYSTHRLNTFQHKCINARDERLIFSTLEVEDCMTDCFLQELNRTYGCVDINNFNLQLNINKHLVSIGYRICPQLIRNNETIENAITMKCKEKCWPECNQLYFQTKSDANYMIKKMNLLPLNKPHVRYTETMHYRKEYR